MSKKTKSPTDFSDLVEVQIPEFLAPIKKDPAELKNALENLLNLEKKTRLAADVPSTTKVVKAILAAIYEQKQWKLLNEYITMLAKRRAQVQTAIEAVINDSLAMVDSTPDKETKEELLKTILAVSKGKMYAELQTARTTRMLSEIKESEGKVADASDILQEVQVETIGSMEMQEKAAFLLDQIRLCLAKKDYVRAEIVANKVNTKVLNEEKYQELKLKFNHLMIEYHGHMNNYFALSKAYREIFNTPIVQEDEQKWKPALVKAIIYLVLSPFDSEVSDLLHRWQLEKRVQAVPSLETALKSFTTDEIMKWPLPFEAEWKADSAFSGEQGAKRWDDLRKRVVQHNIRVVSLYYDRISAPRLQQLLQLNDEKTEEYLSEMVSSKQLWAKIDRPTGIVAFKKKKDADEVVNGWSSDITTLLGLVEKTGHMINKEMTMKRTVSASA